MTQHRYGWKPSVPDHNDIIADPRELMVHPEVDPRSEMPQPYDQGQLGSCTANAIAAAHQYDRMLSDDTAECPNLSRLFIYYGERVREGTVLTDSGAWGRDGFKVLRKSGAPPEDMWPYDPSMFTAKPSDEAYEWAKQRRISAYVHPGLGLNVALIDRVEAFKRLLSNKQTIAFGFSVYESFEEDARWDDGVMPMPYEGEQVLGGHEVLLVGYLSDHPDCGLCRNSWGEGWGLGGYFLMPWKFLASPTYSGDWRSIYREAGK